MKVNSSSSSSSILRDPTIADHLNGTTILKPFPKMNQDGTPSKSKKVNYEGHVTGYRTTNDGDILHKIKYPEDDDEEEFTFNELQTYHQLYLNKNKISSDLSITIPPPANPPPSPQTSQPTPPTNIPIPSGCQSYPFRVAINNEYFPAQITSRQISSHNNISWTISHNTPANTTVQKTISNEEIINLILAGRKGPNKINNPISPLPSAYTFTLPNGVSHQHWTTNHPTIGSIGQIKNLSSPPIQGKKPQNTTFTVHATSTDTTHDSFLVKINGDFDDEFTFLTYQQVADGLFRHTFTRLSPTSFNRTNQLPHFINPISPESSCPLPLNKPTPEQYLHDLENLASRFPDEPLAFFQTGFENALDAQRKCVCRKEAEGARMGTAKKKDNRKS